MSEAFSLGCLLKMKSCVVKRLSFTVKDFNTHPGTQRLQRLKSSWGLGIMSLNESRGLLGLEPVENGDRRLQSLNYVDATKGKRISSREG